MQKITRRSSSKKGRLGKTKAADRRRSRRRAQREHQRKLKRKLCRIVERIRGGEFEAVSDSPLLRANWNLAIHMLGKGGARYMG